MPRSLIFGGRVKLIALRCAGYNNVDLKHAQERGLAVARVPAYSPHAVAEFAVAMLLALNRHLPKALQPRARGQLRAQRAAGNGPAREDCRRDRHWQDRRAVRANHGFGCRLLAVDQWKNPDVEKLGAVYLPLEEALPQSDVISLHCPLTPETRYVINAKTLAIMKRGVLLINTGRGALLDTRAVIEALKNKTLGGLALDVYEEEDKLFFDDTEEIIPDDVFMRLTTFPNVLITGHQVFFTQEALAEIARTTLGNLTEFERSGKCGNVAVAG